MFKQSLVKYLVQKIEHRTETVKSVGYVVKIAFYFNLISAFLQPRQGIRFMR